MQYAKCGIDFLELTGRGRDQAGRDRSYCVASGESKDYRSCCRRLNLKDSKFPVNLDKYANTSAASIPVLLDEMNRMKILKQGQSMLFGRIRCGTDLGRVLI